MKSKTQKALALVLPVQQDIRLPWKRQHYNRGHCSTEEGHSVTGDLTAEKEGILREWLGRNLLPERPRSQVPRLPTAPLGMVWYTPYTLGELVTTITTEALGVAKHPPRHRTVSPQQISTIPKIS